MSNSYVKLVSKDMNNQGLNLGLNIDPCNGLHFCRFKDILHWIRELNYHYICDVTVPEEGRIYESEDNGLYADQLILSNYSTCIDHPLWCDYKTCLNVLSHDGLALEYIRFQTPELCLTAVKQNGRSLQYVKDQTPELRLIAVNNTEQEALPPKK
jgi:hypothetical protein